MKKAIVLSIILFVLVCYAVPVWAGGWTGDVNLFFGKKYLDDDDWGDLDEQNEFGITFDLAKGRWPIHIAVDVLGSKESMTVTDLELEGKTSELCLGVRKIFTIDGSAIFRPYLGGGLAFVHSEMEAVQIPYYSKRSEEDDAVGLWLNAGAYFTLSRHFNIGLDLRYTKAETTLFGNDVEAGGTHAGLLLGYHW